MLFHPSARIDTQFTAAQEVIDWSEELLPEHVQNSDNDFEDNIQPRISVIGLLSRLEEEEDQWNSG